MGVSPAVAVAVAVVLGLLVLPNSAIVEVGLIFLAAKLVLSGRPARGAAAARSEGSDDRHGPRTVVVIVPMFNEDPDIVRALVRSLLGQTRQPDVIHVIDDGSTDPAGLRVVRAAAPGSRSRIAISAHGVNRGKREAIATAVRANPRADVFVTVDSDTVLAPDALERILRAFDAPDVRGATALVRVLNRRRNLLTRLIDLRYANAFLLDRGFQSRFGSVLCACGSLAAWRAQLLRDNLTDFTSQTFLGRPCVYGDDRRLTNYALREGRVVLVPDAIAWTAAPERFGHYLRQQLRWSRSFIRESIWAVGNLPLGRAATWLAFAELASWMLLTAVAVLMVVVAPVTGLKVGLIAAAGYVVVACVMSWVRSVRWFDVPADDDSRFERLAVFAIAPLYAMLHVFVLLPLRCYALITLRANAWGTREHVEVRIGEERLRDALRAPPRPDAGEPSPTRRRDVPPTHDHLADECPRSDAGGPTQWTERPRSSSSTRTHSFARD